MEVILTLILLISIIQFVGVILGFNEVIIILKRIENISNRAPPLFPEMAHTVMKKHLQSQAHLMNSKITTWKEAAMDVSNKNSNEVYNRIGIHPIGLVERAMAMEEQSKGLDLIEKMNKPKLSSPRAEKRKLNKIKNVFNE